MTLQSYAYTLDAAANRTAVTTPAGTESYTLDALNRLTAVAYPNGDTASYTYDANGNRLTEVVNGTTVATYAYDDADQLTSDGTRSYSYDAAGNLTAAGPDTFAWDWADRLTSASVNGATTTYAYDGDGLRVATSSGGATAQTVWDRVGRLPARVQDGATTTIQAGGATEELDAGGTPQYDLADGLGSLRGVTDASGALVGTTDYDVFGGVRAQTGAASALGFTGAPRDATTGLVSLRARDYDPATGRFLSADTVQPNAPGTQGYNRYAYVANNPTTWTDPTGHEVAANVVPVLRDNWLAIGIALGRATAEVSCGPVCWGIAVFIIVVLVIAACVIDHLGPCWRLEHAGATADADTTTKATDKAGVDIGPDVRFPDQPTPSSDPNCIDNPVPWGGDLPKGREDIPPVANTKLRNFIEYLFRTGPQEVPGGTAGAIREELRTGKLVGGKSHIMKGEQAVQGLSNLIKSGKLSDADRAVAEWIENDLTNALSGC